MNRVRTIANVSNETWNKFSSKAKSLGLKQAKYLQLLIERQE